MLFSSKYQETWEKMKIIYLQDVEITQHTWGHIVRLWVEGIHGPRISWAHFLLVNLKHKSGNLKGREKNKWLKRSVIEIGSSAERWPSFLSSLFDLRSGCLLTIKA